MAEQLEGKVESFPSQNQGFNTPAQLRMSELKSLFVDQMAPDYYEMCRNAKIFGVTTTVAVAVVPLQVVPTTTAAFVLNNVSTTNTLVVPLAISVLFASGTAAVGSSIYAQVGSTPLATQLTADGTGVVKSCLRGGVATGSVCWGDSSKTVAGGWQLIGGINTTAATTPGYSVSIPVNGMYVVRPTYALGLHVLSGAGTTAAFSYSVIWAELPGTAS